MAVSQKLQHLTYTAIPRGFGSGGELRVGVRITPRLSYAGSGGALRDFPDFVRWPVGGFWWSATFDGGVTWEPAADEIWASDGGFWEAAFHPDLRVDPQPIARTAAPPAALSIRGYPYRVLAADVRGYHLGAELQVTDLGRRLSQVLFPDPANPLPPQDPVQQFFRFYRQDSETSSAPAEPVQLTPDFHQRISMIGDHGPLLERLGLVLELRFPPRGGLAPVSTVAVRLNWETPDGGTSGDHPTPFTVPTRHASPLTRVRYQPGAVFAVARSLDDQARLDDLLRVDAGEGGVFSAHDIDVDGSLIAASGATSASAAPPPPSTAGFHLVLDDTAGKAERRLAVGNAAREEMRLGADDSQGRLQPADLPALDSDHLVHGFEIEVQHLQEPGSPWRGLCHREVVYTARTPSEHEFSFTARGIAPVVTAFRKVPAPDRGAVGADLVTSDVLARWDGWSLAVQRPGIYELEGPVPDPESPGGWIEIDPRLPGGDAYRLPVLRFGHQYRFRLRAVDITGFAHAWAGATPSEAETYYRYDPVPPPLVLSPRTLSRTESSRRLVVRSGALVPPGTGTFRALVPPRTSVETAITHGLFDRGGAPDPDAWGAISDLDERVPATEAFVPIVPSATLQPTHVDWLPDPTCTRIGLSLPSGTAGRLVVAGFLPPGADDVGKNRLGDWRSVSLRLAPVATPGRVALLPAVQQNGHAVVTVELGPGETTTLEARGLPPVARLEELGLLEASPELRNELVPDPIDGELIDRLCPPVELTLVHAVPQPLTAPAPVGEQRLTRGFDDTTVGVRAMVEHDPKTTGRLTLYADWTEWRDLGPGAPRLAPPDRIAALGIECGDITTDDEPTAVVRGRLVLPDRRRRDIRLSVTATGRYLEEFRRTLDIGFTRVTGAGWLLDLPDNVDVESVRLLRDGRDLERATDYELARDPRSKRRTLRLLDPSNRNDVVVVGVLSPVTRSATLANLVAPAAMTPPPPEVAYVVPAFENTVDPLGGGSGRPVATRGKPRVRIWLERPWWSSGDEEKLAVIWRMDRPPPVNPSEADFPGWYADEDRLSKLVTMVAQDPTEVPGAFELGAAEEDWKRMQPQPVTGVAHPEPIQLPGTGVQDPPSAWVQLHDVEYDEDRDMYYAEVGWDDEEYGMFVRLAVARFQEFVTDGQSQLSMIHTIDPVQLWPSRTATARNISNQDGPQVEIVVTGPEQDAHRLPRQLRVSLQKRVHAGDDHLGWDTVSSTSASDLTTPLRLPRPGGKGKYRLLVEEYEKWPSRRPQGNPANATYKKDPRTVATAYDDLVGLRPVWVTTLPLPVD